MRRFPLALAITNARRILDSDPSARHPSWRRRAGGRVYAPLSRPDRKPRRHDVGAPTRAALTGPAETKPSVEDERATGAARRFHDERIAASLCGPLQVLEVTHD